MSNIQLKDLFFQPEDVYPAVRCHLDSPGVRPRGGTISEIRRNGAQGFRLYEARTSFRFTIDAKDTAQDIADALGRGYRVLAQVDPVRSDDDRAAFLLCLVRLAGYQKFPPMKIIVDEKTFSLMKKQDLVARNADDPGVIGASLALYGAYGKDPRMFFAYYDPGEQRKRKRRDKGKDGKKGQPDAGAPAEAADGAETEAENPVMAEAMAEAMAAGQGEPQAAETAETAAETAEPAEATEMADAAPTDATGEAAAEEDATAGAWSSKDKWMAAVLNRQLKPAKKLVLLGQAATGRSFSLTVGLYEWDDAASGEHDVVLFTDRFRTRKPQYIPCAKLGFGAFTFTAEKETSSELLTRMLHREDTYLAVWRKYLQMEKQMNLQKARAIGVLAYATPALTQEVVDDDREKRDAYTVPLRGDVREALKVLAVGDTLCFGEQLPAYLANPEMTADEYEAVRKDEKLGNRTICRLEKAPDTANKTLTVSVAHGDLLKGQLYYCDIGDQAQVDRRERAQASILGGHAANPRLGMIIGVGADALDAAELFGAQEGGKEIPARSPLVDEKIFRHPPTPTQERAIHIALNTPDIAIIQGPPGTGKTTVITAIIERLNELSDKAEAEPGQVLITSLQHDAVYNVIERLRINSLPTIKFGRRRKDDGTLQDAVDHWRLDLADRLADASPAFRETELEKRVAHAYQMYSLRPTKENARIYLETAEPFATSDELRAQCAALREKYAPHQASAWQDLLPAIYRLRTKKRGFADDGRTAALDLRMQLLDLDFAERGGEENRAILETLRAASRCLGDLPQELAARLERCKEELLARCIPQPVYEEETLDKDMVAFQADLQAHLHHPQNAMDGVIYDFWCELEDSPEHVNRAIANYAFPYAATAQQSLVRDLRDIKGKQPEYDTVIVDEAARVPPPDLLIPLSQAKKRIILVGDHRQLPHMYEAEVFEQLEESGEHVEMMDVKMSLFEFLFQRAKALEKLDHRQRHITLDMQYRMHPLLGAFVNDNFYETYGEHFDSGLPEDMFQQPFEAAPLLWLDVKNGTMQQDADGSKFRDAEVDAIFAKVQAYRAIIRAPQATDAERATKIGIISFYGAQVRRIQKRLRAAGLAAELESGDIHVGTVDSFQGMEFDIVFLSVVRDTPPQKNRDRLQQVLAKPKDERTEDERAFIERAARKTFGFLTMENRLCVAMSRQKKLLVVAGTSQIFTKGEAAKLADEEVPALKHFYELCKEKEMVEHV